MLRVLIADDHAVVRRGIRQILTEGLAFPHIGEAPETIELIRMTLEEEWDIIISDISMPGGGGLEALRAIRKQKPAQPILIVSIFPEEHYAVKVLSMGAAGYLNKDAATDELLNAVKIILSGRRYIQPVIAEKLTDNLRKQAGLMPHELLSEREQEVLMGLVRGQSVSDIALLLEVSPNTVSTYRTRILMKMDMKNNADLITYAISNGIV